VATARQTVRTAARGRPDQPPTRPPGPPTPPPCGSSSSRTTRRCATCSSNGSAAPASASAAPRRRAQDAVALYERHRPQLVLADVRLKDGDGITLTAELRRRFPDSRVLVISGGDDEGLGPGRGGGRGGQLHLRDRRDHRADGRVLSAAQGRQHVYDSVTAFQVIAVLQSGQRRRPSDLFALTTRKRECLEVTATGVTTTRGAPRPCTCRSGRSRPTSTTCAPSSGRTRGRPPSRTATRLGCSSPGARPSGGS